MYLWKENYVNKILKYGSHKISGSVTNAINDTNEEKLQGSQSTLSVIEDLNESNVYVKTLESLEKME